MQALAIINKTEKYILIETPCKTPKDTVEYAIKVISVPCWIPATFWDSGSLATAPYNSTREYLNRLVTIRNNLDLVTLA